MMQYSVDESRYVSDPLEGETIVMDLVQGRVFLLEMGAAVLWGHVLRGVSRGDILTEVETRYGTGQRVACEQFITRLVELELTAEVEGGRASDQGLLKWPLELGELLLTQYDDMTSIITMDPIHDVDPERGWPFENHR